MKKKCLAVRSEHFYLILTKTKYIDLLNPWQRWQTKGSKKRRHAMNKRNFQALVMTCVMITSVMLSGCNNSGKKSGKKSKAEKDVTALLDDVCAYIKSAKSSKLERLIDGRSKWVGALEDYSEAEVKDVFEAARKRIDYSIEDVKADDEEGEALIVFSYFDTKDCKKSIDRDSTNKEIAKAVADAKDEEIEVEVEVVSAFGNV